MFHTAGTRGIAVTTLSPPRDAALPLRGGRHRRTVNAPTRNIGTTSIAKSHAACASWMRGGARERGTRSDWLGSRAAQRQNIPIVGAGETEHLDVAAEAWQLRTPMRRERPPRGRPYQPTRDEIHMTRTWCNVPARCTGAESGDLYALTRQADRGLYCELRSGSDDMTAEKPPARIVHNRSALAGEWHDSRGSTPIQWK